MSSESELDNLQFLYHAFMFFLKTNSVSSTSHQNGLYPSSKKAKVDGANGESERSWKVRASCESHDCVNPVRSCEEIYFKEALEKRDKSKELIKVSIGESCEIVKLAIMCSDCDKQ